MSLGNFFRIIRANGGYVKSFLTLMRTDDLKFGKPVGEDPMGNTYYENNYYFFLRNRWVIFSDAYGYDFDASHIHPMWFRWLHQTTDYTPDIDPLRKTHSWMLPYEDNQTGTPREFYPYSTTLPKIKPWDPKNPCPCVCS